MLEGKKTYITGALIAVVAFARHLAWVTPEMADTITNLLLGGGLVFLRSGIANK